VLIIVYLPSFQPDDWNSRKNTHEAILKAVTLYSGVRPHTIIPLEASQLPKSSLGKLPRSKIRQAFEDGEYDKYQQVDVQMIHDHHGVAITSGKTVTEMLILRICDEYAVSHLSCDLKRAMLTSL